MSGDEEAEESAGEEKNNFGPGAGGGRKMTRAGGLNRRQNTIDGGASSSKNGNMDNNVRARRQSVAAIGLGGEINPGGVSSRGTGNNIDSSSRTPSLTTIGANSSNYGSIATGLNTSANNSSANMISGGSRSSSKSNLVEAQNAQDPLYSTLIKKDNSEKKTSDKNKKSINKRRESSVKSTASLLMAAAPSIMSKDSKKSVCFSETIRTNDGELLSPVEDEELLDDDEDEKQQAEEDEELLDEEEQRMRTLDKMKRRRENATKIRTRKYGYDPLNPPIPKSWAEWSMQRRDYQAALAEVLQCNKQPQLSTAAMKGRKDSVAFVKEDLIDIHLNKKQGENTLLGKIESEKAEKKEPKRPPKNRKGGPMNRHHAAQLSDVELEILKAYYYHPLFSGSRAVSFLCDLTAITFIIFAVALPFWFKIPHKVEPFGPEYLYQLSMFQNCTILLSEAKKEHSLFADLRDFASDLKEAVDHGNVAALTHSAGSASLDAKPVAKQKQGELPPSLTASENVQIEGDGNDNQPGSAKIDDEGLVDEALEFIASNHTINYECEHYSLGAWQTFLIGVMLFGALFGIFGFFIGMCGACSSALPNRLYYYHSAAEMLFVSALVTGLAVIFFPLCVRYKVDIMVFSYGHGFYVGLASVVWYIISAVLLNLDVFIMCTVPEKDEKRRRK